MMTKRLVDSISVELSSFSFESFDKIKMQLPRKTNDTHTQTQQRSSRVVLNAPAAGCCCCNNYKCCCLLSSRHRYKKPDNTAAAAECDSQAASSMTLSALPLLNKLLYKTTNKYVKFFVFFLTYEYNSSTEPYDVGKEPS